MVRMTLDEIWDYLLTNELFTEEELQLVTCINGYNEETLNDMMYARYGMHDIYQLKWSMELEEE